MHYTDKAVTNVLKAHLSVTETARSSTAWMNAVFACDSNVEPRSVNAAPLIVYIQCAAAFKRPQV
jgi:hypothetical protein